jgi:hypothetical protein
MKADYGWIILVVFVIILAASWSTIMGGIKSFQGRNFDQAAYDRGASLFTDVNAWTPLENKSCAMCHSADYVHTEDAAKMDDYVKGSPVLFKDLTKKYKSDPLGNQDALYEQAMICMTGPDRMGLRRASEKSAPMLDLMEYLRNQ